MALQYQFFLFARNFSGPCTLFSCSLSCCYSGISASTTRKISWQSWKKTSRKPKKPFTRQNSVLSSWKITLILQRYPPKARKRPKNHNRPPTQQRAPMGIESKITAASGIQTSIVSIKDLKIDRRENSLSVNFKLARSSSGRSPIRGYIFIIAVDQSTDPPRFWPSPKAAFENGTPINPNKGQAYKIRNFRRIRVRWSFASAEKTPSLLRILVYDQSGGLLLKEDYSLEKDQNQ